MFKNQQNISKKAKFKVFFTVITLTILVVEKRLKRLFWGYIYDPYSFNVSEIFISVSS